MTGDGERAAYDETLSGIQNKSSPSCSRSFVLNHPVMIPTCSDSYLSDHHSVHDDLELFVVGLMFTTLFLNFCFYYLLICRLS